MGLALSVALAARGPSLTLRAAAAASCVPFLAALYLTFFAGCICIALGAGLIAALAMTRVGSAYGLKLSFWHPFRRLPSSSLRQGGVA